MSSKTTPRRGRPRTLRMPQAIETILSEHNWSLTDLARAMGTTPVWLSEVMRGASLSQRFIASMATATGLTPQSVDQAFTASGHTKRGERGAKKQPVRS